MCVCFLPSAADGTYFVKSNLQILLGEFVFHVVIGNESATRVQVLNNAVYISHSAYNLLERHESNYSPSSCGQIVKQTALKPWYDKKKERDRLN